jgi:V/A-type H+-transporting ATPase subunit D
MAERTPTRSEYLALQEERQLMQEGHQFLDEKRISLAQEIIRQLAGYEGLQSEYMATHAAAVTHLAAGAARHGLEGLGVYPPRLADPGGPALSRRRFLGQELLDFEALQAQVLPEPALPAIPSPEAEHCAAAFTGLVELAARLALSGANLRRLTAEYQRTERRARALENVLLPEIDRSIRFMDEQLEAVDQEEALRVRFVSR